MADVTDSKSVGLTPVWVRVPPPAPSDFLVTTGKSEFFYPDFWPSTLKLTLIGFLQLTMDSMYACIFSALSLRLLSVV